MSKFETYSYQTQSENLHHLKVKKNNINNYLTTALLYTFQC
jgi:hypothetical protein